MGVGLWGKRRTVSLGLNRENSAIYLLDDQRKVDTSCKAGACCCSNDRIGSSCGYRT